MFPSLSATRPCGPEFFPSTREYSLNVPVAGSSRPSLLAIWSVNHSAPSSPTAGSCGCAPFVGTSHSRIVTFRSLTSVAGPAPRDARETPVPGLELCRPKLRDLYFSYIPPCWHSSSGEPACLYPQARRIRTALVGPFRYPLRFASLIIRVGVPQGKYRSFPSFLYQILNRWNDVAR